jgi:uncharacterized membrane protein
VINNAGIVLEIIGFVLILLATGRMKQETGGFSSGFDHVENVMSIVRPRFYFIGIALVIVGLGIQIIPSFL